MDETTASILDPGRGKTKTGQRSRISAKSRLGENFAYVSRHWDGLQTFLTDGRAEIDSNGVERKIRPIASGWSLYTPSLSAWKH